MKIIYSRSFEKRYATNPVESPDRVSLSAHEQQGYEFVEPSPASLQDIARVHGREHIERVKAGGLYDVAALAAGGAVAAAKLDLEESLPSPWCSHRATTLLPSGPGRCATSTTWPSLCSE